ncbi:hypothetical protein KY361_02145 [Candidatus Woesearchaeota archaeon]|nr:hypothetical protein [Candidatus Woesearchaeota archaeon]
MIESYSFGTIRINGRAYSNDVIIAGDKIINWFREEGHNARIIDFKNIPNNDEVLVIGTGANGVMKVSEEVVDYFKDKNVELIIKPTGEAVKTFNQLKKQNKKVAGAFHLTC